MRHSDVLSGEQCLKEPGETRGEVGTWAGVRWKGHVYGLERKMRTLVK